MQINNSTNQSFKALSFTPRALNAISKRVSAGKFISIQENLGRKYKTSPLDIVVDTTGEGSLRLATKIKQNESTKNIKKIAPEYFEETIFSSIFNRYEKYIEKLCEIIDQQEILLLGKKSRGGRDLMV